VNELFQHTDALEQKVVALEAQKLQHSVDGCGQHEMHVNDEIDHLDERLRRAEADLAYMNDSQQCSDMHDNRIVSTGFLTYNIFPIPSLILIITHFPFME